MVDKGHYYRMKVGLTYKGKPVDIDFVAGCGVHIGHDASGSSIEEITGMTDLFRSVRMPEGHAVIINSYPDFESPRFNPCEGDTTDHSSNEKIDTSVPKDWLPFIVWFERDDEFAHGIGYLTQDAYENKNARFGFRYARIEHATRAEFEAFRETGPANLLPWYQTDWMTGGPEAKDLVYLNAEDVPEGVRRNPESGWRKTLGRVCTGVIRTRLGDRERAILHEAWPKNHPDYWTDGDLNRHLASKLLRSNQILYRGSILVTKFQGSQPREQSPEVFPITLSPSLARLTTVTLPIVDADILIGDGVSNLGQVLCDDFSSAIVTAVITKPFNFGCDASINGKRLPLHLPNGCNDLEIVPFFYRDQYVIATIHAFRS